MKALLQQEKTIQRRQNASRYFPQIKRNQKCHEKVPAKKLPGTYASVYLPDQIWQGQCDNPSARQM